MYLTKRGEGSFWRLGRLITSGIAICYLCVISVFLEKIINFPKYKIGYSANLRTVAQLVSQQFPLRGLCGKIAVYSSRIDGIFIAGYLHTALQAPVSQTAYKTYSTLHTENGTLSRYRRMRESDLTGGRVTENYHFLRSSSTSYILPTYFPSSSYTPWPSQMLLTWLDE